MGFRNPTTSLPADAITAGALPAGVTITADQVNAGVLTGSVVRTGAPGPSIQLDPASTVLGGARPVLELYPDAAQLVPGTLSSDNLNAPRTRLTAPVIDASSSASPAELNLSNSKAGGFAGVVNRYAELRANLHRIILRGDQTGDIGSGNGGGQLVTWDLAAALVSVLGKLDLSPASGEAFTIQGNPIVYAVASSTDTVTVAAGSTNGAQVVNLPASRFPVTPLIFCQPFTSLYTVSVTARSASQFTATARQIDAGTAGASVSFGWLAFLIKSTTVTG